MNKQVKQFIKELEQRGWSLVRHTGTGHIKMRLPTGAVTFLPSSPSDNRWVRNKLAEVKRLERV